MSDDDDESTHPGEVTVPPWLRSGPGPGHSPRPTSPAAAPASDDAGDDPRDGQADLPGETPNRITLGVRSSVEPPREPEGPVGPDDDLSTLPLRAAEPGAPASMTSPVSAVSPVSTTPTGSEADDGPADGGETPGAPARTGAGRPATGPARGLPRNRLTWFAVAGAAVLAGSGVLGYLLTRGVMDAPAADASACATSEGSDRVVGDGPGSLDTPAGAVLAFDHAYYVERDVDTAFEAVAPSSRMSKEQVQDEGIEQIVDGTTHCVAVGEISPTLLDVTLTEFPPDDAPPVEIRQRIRVEQVPDGTWGIVSITPAG